MKASENTAFNTRYGSWALVTGATSGIGAELAMQLAEKGLNLVLVSRKQQSLNKKAKEITSKYKVEVKTIKADLSIPKTYEIVMQQTQNLEIGLFIPNAGMESHGLITDLPIDRELAMIELNVTSVYALLHHYAGKMVARKKGGILLVSSIGGHGPNPYWSNYAGTKAYILNLGLSMHYEMKQKGVDLTVLSPGHTITPMTDAINGEIDMTKTPMSSMYPDEVAKVGLAALGKQPYVIPGTKNKMMVFMSSRIMPIKTAIEMGGKLMEKAFRNQL